MDTFFSHYHIDHIYMSSVLTPKFPYHHIASLILVGYEDSTITRALGLDRDQQMIMSRGFHKIHKR